MLTLNLLNVQTVLVALTVGLLVYFIRRRFIYRLPPGPWAIPLIGNFEVYTKPLLHRVVLQLSKKYGPVTLFSFGPIRTVFLNNYEVVMEAMVKRKADFAGRPASVTFSLVSEGYKDIAVASYSPMWQYHRRVAIKALSKEIGDSDVEFLLREKDLINKTVGNGLREDMLPFLKDVYPSGRYVIIKEAADRVFSFLHKLLHEHQETFDPNNIRDFTDHLLVARSEAEKSGDDESLEKLNDTYLVQTVSDIFFAGVDTTRLTLEWFLCFMSGLPEIQAKCHAEIDKKIGRRCPSIADRQSLPYTEACIYETMRAGVIAGLGLPHLTICDTHVGGYDIPKDTVVLINHFALHRDTKYWKDPEKFDPLRYLDEDGKMDPTKLDSWLPFSAGRRVCLGESIAKSEILMMCVHLLQWFEITLPEGTKPNFVGVQRDFFGTECPADLRIIVKKRFK
ncbi:steroid 17-alpha-hydroxylase/17,20 lyase-like isoform X3 [Crassostrea angulata]|uniref:steroid 17-alpha-hydroxylase/17,20 lyase-like isoform X3 n=1 Tax=Magallana angulata TaxID=2784310 RepID=UPI0022B1B855|nr:steroid 17-alpha-hydroxylase/17,20 lyase-like isoform X3 [Crassostrea angulata]